MYAVGSGRLKSGALEPTVPVAVGLLPQLESPRVPANRAPGAPGEPARCALAVQRLLALPAAEWLRTDPLETARTAVVPVWMHLGSAREPLLHGFRIAEAQHDHLG